MLEAWHIILLITSAFGAWTVTLAWLVWWLSEQFKRNRDATYVSSAQVRNDFAVALEKIEHRIRQLELWRARSERLHSVNETK